jgi:hypothetical protein
MHKMNLDSLGDLGRRKRVGLLWPEARAQQVEGAEAPVITNITVQALFDRG